jgi:predicted ArsR family transcriptional regulator
MAEAHYPHTPGHKGSVETGRDAARAYATEAGRRQRQVLDSLTAGPATAEQIAARIDLHWYLVRPRLSELKAKGLVRDTGERRQTALGGKTCVHRLATPEEVAAFQAEKARANG